MATDSEKIIWKKVKQNSGLIDLNVFCFFVCLCYINSKLTMMAVRRSSSASLSGWICHHIGHHFLYLGWCKIKAMAFWTDLASWVPSEWKELCGLPCRDQPGCESSAWLTTSWENHGLQSHTWLIHNIKAEKLTGIHANTAVWSWIKCPVREKVSDICQHSNLILNKMPGERKSIWYLHYLISEKNMSFQHVCRGESLYCLSSDEKPKSCALRCVHFTSFVCSRLALSWKWPKLISVWHDQIQKQYYQNTQMIQVMFLFLIHLDNKFHHSRYIFILHAVGGGGKKSDKV